MSGIDISNGKIVITNGARTVATTDGTLVGFLPPSQNVNISTTIVYPDVGKDVVYNFDWLSQYTSAGGGHYGLRSMCWSGITGVPQEWESSQILRSGPPGADFFFSKVILQRISAPTHPWMGNSVDVLPPQNVEIPFFGSVLLEAELGMARALSIYTQPVIVGGVEVRQDLILHQQQSVSAAPGGWGYTGDARLKYLATSGGHELVYNSQPGLPIWVGTAPDYVKASFGDSDSPAIARLHQRGNAAPCSMTDPTNYSSTYVVKVNGKFGRRS